ncbi:MAG: PHP domain-containing protein [Spirochaetales bacterium]|nr:PHP domain-containing protein [Spirochaetales bacterium]
MRVLCDFHNHSCLSPCGSLELSPKVLAELAAARGLGIVALTDHNSALNCPAFEENARRAGLAALYGMEATTSEEVHVLCLFGRVDEALDFGRFLAENAPPFPHDARLFGDQAVVDADENVLDLVEDRWLVAALGLGFAELCSAASARGALVIPAHVDRAAYGAIAQLGFLPEASYDAVEALGILEPGQARGRRVVTGSDAHEPGQVGRRSFALELEDGWTLADGTVSVAALREALRLPARVD